MERGRQDEAEALLAKAVAACPVDSEARRNYAEALWRRGAKAEAVEQMNQAATYAGEDASFWVRLAEMNLSLGNLSEADRCARQALDLEPKMPEAWAARASVRRAAGMKQDALADYMRAMRYSPGNRQILWQTSDLYREMNQPERALQALQNFVETYPPGEEPQRALYMMGQAYIALGRYDDAVDRLAAAATRETPSADVFFALGQAQLLSGRPQEAFVAAQNALSVAPQHQASRELLQRADLALRSPSGNMRR